MLLNPTIQPYEIMNIVNVAWEELSAKVGSNKNAISERDWMPYNRNLMTYPCLCATMTTEEKGNELLANRARCSKCGYWGDDMLARHTAENRISSESGQRCGKVSGDEATAGDENEETANLSDISEGHFAWLCLAGLI